MATAEQLAALLPQNPNACVHAAGILFACARAVADTEDGRKQAEEASLGLWQSFATQSKPR